MVTLPIGYYDKNLAFSYPVGVNPEQTVSYDPINNTLIVTTVAGVVTGWSARLLNPSVAESVENAPDKIVYINTILGYPPVSVVFID